MKYYESFTNAQYSYLGSEYTLCRVVSTFRALGILTSLLEVTGEGIDRDVAHHHGNAPGWRLDARMLHFQLVELKVPDKERHETWEKSQQLSLVSGLASNGAY